MTKEPFDSFLQSLPWHSSTQRTNPTDYEIRIYYQYRIADKPKEGSALCKLGREATRLSDLWSWIILEGIANRSVLIMVWHNASRSSLLSDIAKCSTVNSKKSSHTVQRGQRRHEPMYQRCLLNIEASISKAFFHRWIVLYHLLRLSRHLAKPEQRGHKALRQAIWSPLLLVSASRECHAVSSLYTFINARIISRRRQRQLPDCLDAEARNPVSQHWWTRCPASYQQMQLEPWFPLHLCNEFRVHPNSGSD